MTWRLETTRHQRCWGSHFTAAPRRQCYALPTGAAPGTGTRPGIAAAHCPRTSTPPPAPAQTAARQWGEAAVTGQDTAEHGDMKHAWLQLQSCRAIPAQSRCATGGEEALAVVWLCNQHYGHLL